MHIPKSCHAWRSRHRHGVVNCPANKADDPVFYRFRGQQLKQQSRKASAPVRILPRDELDKVWEPETDRHLTVWECLQHLVRKYENDGLSHETAVLLKKIEGKAEAVKDLAYCLYDISANKRKDAKEATAYNALIADWTELTRQAAAIHDTGGDRQIRLDI